MLNAGVRAGTRTIHIFPQIHAMAASEEFCSAAFRHLDDAQHLLMAGRADNAAYLAGYAVECSVKLLVCCSDISPKALGHDLANLAGRALILAVILSPGARRYVFDDSDVEFALQRWVPKMRYAATGNVSGPDADRLVRAGEACLQEIVCSLVLDGVVEFPA